MDHRRSDRSREAAFVRERLASETGPLFVNSVVLAETVWVLRRRAKLGPEQVANVVDGLLNAPTVRLQQPDAVADALASFLKDRGGFADHLIGEINRHAGCKDDADIRQRGVQVAPL